MYIGRKPLIPASNYGIDFSRNWIWNADTEALQRKNCFPMCVNLLLVRITLNVKSHLQSQAASCVKRIWILIFISTQKWHVTETATARNCPAAFRGRKKWVGRQRQPCKWNDLLLAREALQWLAFILNGNYIDWKTNGLSWSLQRTTPRAAGPLDRTDTSPVIYWIYCWWQTVFNSEVGGHGSTICAMFLIFLSFSTVEIISMNRKLSCFHCTLAWHPTRFTARVRGPRTKHGTCVIHFSLFVTGWCLSVNLCTRDRLNSSSEPTKYPSVLSAFVLFAFHFVYSFLIRFVACRSQSTCHEIV